jgi:gamma-glutamyl hercynylcysteine S-oxide synthase
VSIHSPHSPPLGGVEALLEDARERTLRLVRDVSDQDLDHVHDPLMSPLVWDLGHIAAFEDLWVSRETGRESVRADLAATYDAFETPRASRGELAYLRRDEALAYMGAVRERTFAALEHVSAFIAEMLIQHEHQHNETMLQTLQLAQPGVYRPERTEPDARPAEAGSVLVEAGPFTLGAGGREFSYDNERPRHELDLPAFRIDRSPVTNVAFAEFVADGGYRRRELWSEAGWAIRENEGWERPLFWTADGAVRRFDRTVEREPELPVMHVSFFEAEAYAAWRGARLPSEAEWEKAARAHRGSGNLDQLDFGPGPAGPFVGDCWEWTSSEFDGYPGFEPHPYPEYSQVFFREGYRVLRGASWATRPRVARVSFRNWDLPRRRQIFSGFRCAEDAP